MNKILLADDDLDDCLFFQEALEELSLSVTLTTVNDGVQLMDLLNSKASNLPEVLFLDMKTPRKSGFDCLSEIKENQRIKELPVVIISTSYDLEMINKLHSNGAHYYIRKPGDFNVLKKVLQEVTELLSKNNYLQPDRSNFIIKS